MSDSTVTRETARLLEPDVEHNVTLAPFTTYRIGGPADLLVRAQTIEQLCRVSAAVATTGIDVLVIGEGSNLLVADEGWPGLVVVLEGSAFDSIEVRGTEVIAGASVKLPVLARRSVSAGLSGLEWMVGVPGSVGGAIRMNAGGHGADCAANVQSVQTIDLGKGGGVETKDASALALAYRTSALGPAEVVVQATFGCTPGNTDESEEVLRDIVRWRRSNQPGGANCGSVFTNPPGDSAGRLIDQCGLKGHRRGTAFVSDKHANFIQADTNGQAADVWVLIADIRTAVYERTGIVLHPEVRTAGFNADLPQLGLSLSITEPTETTETTEPAHRDHG